MVYSREQYLRYFPPPAREPPATYPQRVMYRECYEVKKPKYISSSSPWALFMSPNGEVFAEKQVISIDFKEGNWVKKVENVKIKTENGEFEKFVLDEPLTGETIELFTRYVGFGLHVGDNKYVLREPKRK